MKKTLPSGDLTCGHCGGLHYGSYGCVFTCPRCNRDIRPDANPRCECAPQPLAGPSQQPKLNCYGLTASEWDAVCEIASEVHLKLVEVEPGEDAFDEESLILSAGLVKLWKRAKLTPKPGAAHDD